MSGKGSHAIMQKRLESSTVTIPVPLHKELKRGTLNSIIRQSKIPKENFKSFKRKKRNPQNPSLLNNIHILDLQFLGHSKTIASFLVETDDGPIFN